MKRPIKIAIQGYPGAFHEIAARRFYHGSLLEIMPADTFEDVVTLLEHEDADCGMMAIENSIAGSLLPNYGLIERSKLKICGEVYLRINQNLLAVPGSTMNDITEVHSHYMAIAQCKSFFKDYPHIKLVETKDTAASAQYIIENNLTHVGAIASELAAELYSLDVLFGDIQTNKLNYTRFFVLDKLLTDNLPEDFDKVSVSFSLSHEMGSLFKVLNILNHYAVNLTKIQSTPIIERPWEYLFFVDFLLNAHEGYTDMLAELTNATQSFRILGQYKSGIHHEY